MEKIAKHKRNMKEAMLRMNDEQRARLRWHAEKGTAIICGENSISFWADGAGGG